MEQLTSRSDVIKSLTRSKHGDIKEYSDPVRAVAKGDPEFLAHLIAWNFQEGSIKDSKRALPLFSLAEKAFPGHFVENSLAHLASLDPREFCRAIYEGKSLRIGSQGRSLSSLVEQYLRFREGSFGLWEAAFIGHRKSMISLYCRFHIKPGSPLISRAIEKDEFPQGSTLWIIQRLPKMSAREALGASLQRKIPMKVLLGAMREKLRDTDALLAVINAMTPTELVAHAKDLQNFGMKSNPVLRAAYNERLSVAKAATPKQALLRAGEAAKALGSSEVGRDMVALQDAQVKNVGIQGRWAVLGDRSSSMQEAIEASRFLAGTLTSMVKEDVHLVFFNAQPRYVLGTGKDYSQIAKETEFVTAEGGTSIGCGLEYLLQRGIEVDAIAIASDGAENTVPLFISVYERYCKKIEKVVPVYLYWMKCHQPNTYNNDPDRLRKNMEVAGHALEVFDLRGGFDHYSLLNIARTMRVNKYSLADEIMNVPLLRLKDVFTRKEVKEHASVATIA